MFDMKRLLPAVVLVFSLSAMGLYVWKSSQKGKVTAAEEKATTDASQGDFLEPKIIVTDEEVRATRDAMMSTSKSGLIMSEEDVRKMLEEEKKAEKAGPPVPAVPDTDDLAPSSKNPGRAISPEQMKELIESIQQQAQPK
jgi:hypothetical protein